jgi:hypothetical protein
MSPCSFPGCRPQTQPALPRRQRQYMEGCLQCWYWPNAAVFSRCQLHLPWHFLPSSNVSLHEWSGACARLVVVEWLHLPPLPTLVDPLGAAPARDGMQHQDRVQLLPTYQRKHWSVPLLATTPSRILWRGHQGRVCRHPPVAGVIVVEH